MWRQHVETFCQSFLKGTLDAKATLHIKDPVKQSGGSATLCSAAAFLSSHSPQSAGNCKLLQIPGTFWHKAFRHQGVSPYCATMTQSAPARQKTGFNRSLKFCNGPPGARAWALWKISVVVYRELCTLNLKELKNFPQRKVAENGGK